MNTADLHSPPLMRWQPVSDDLPQAVPAVESATSPALALLEALRHLSFRGVGPDAWAAPLSDNPLAFMLDAVGDVINVWTSNGELVFSNRVPSGRDPEPTRDAQVFERRCLPFTLLSAHYTLEVIRELPRGWRRAT